MAYGNRTDLNNAAKQAQFTGQQYGQATAQRRAQQQVPTGAAPTDDVPITPLSAPTQRPDEPVTAGIDSGPGPGSEAMAPIAIAPGSRDDMLLRLRAIASRFPNPVLLTLMRQMERSR
jgi:hypothetical protein